MIREALRRLRRAGVLGINSRNADYIMRWNPRSHFPLVDNKVLTKRMAEKHGIPTPPVYLLIEKHGDLPALRKLLEGRAEFAVKPARGSGGSGIVLVREQSEKGYVTQSGEVISFSDFAHHASDILSGIFSLSGLEDVAIVEALIHPDAAFAAVSYQGVPDVRIVVYRGVPAMSMVRLPTKASDGKANLHRGAIGAGIEISKGTTVTAVHRSQIVARHPDTGNPVSGIQVPYWEEMLRIAAGTYEMTGLGYIGVDIALDRDRGPLLLELNARPGLAIQLANGHGLRERLEQIDRIPAGILADPGERVGWARHTFH